MKYSMTCSCGDVMSIEADSKDDAVAKVKALMTEDAVEAHMSLKHPGQSVPSQRHVHEMIEENLEAVIELELKK